MTFKAAEYTLSIGSPMLAAFTASNTTRPSDPAADSESISLISIPGNSIFAIAIAFSADLYEELKFEDTVIQRTLFETFDASLKASR